MGYFTHYTWEMKPETPEARNYVEDHAEEMYGILPDGSSDEATKWYDHEENMREMSKHFPGVLFILHRIGEENGDMCNKYFRDGKMQAARAHITFDDFDEAKLQ